MNFQIEVNGLDQIENSKVKVVMIKTRLRSVERPGLSCFKSSNRKMDDTDPNTRNTHWIYRRAEESFGSDISASQLALALGTPGLKEVKGWTEDLTDFHRD